ncbi:MAG: PD40 domain-containing protein [Candidatus Aminicenantes bacterium]|nr:PD40 domain-containing protein [Candidatus Aminicenantes bacterium]
MKYRSISVGILLPFLFLWDGHAHQNDFSVLKGPYLGQKPPGEKPEIFAPGIVSSSKAWEFAVTFSPDGREVYFTRRTEGGRTTIMISCWEKDGWTAPVIAPFSGRHSDFEAHISPDGSTLFFNRYDPNDKTIQDGIWIMRRSADGWSEPTYAGPGMYATATRKGYVYLTDRSGPPEKQGIVRTRLINDRLAEFEWQEGGVNSPAPDRKAGRHPYISPDESFIIFDSYEKGTDDTGRLFICFRNTDGSWSKAIDLGFPPAICASLSPDGKYLFFGSDGGISGNMTDIYWVDAKIIEELQPKQQE